jgi:hypothetical protein
VFFSIAFITDKVLYTLAMAVGIHNFVDVPLLGAVFGDYGLWAGWFPVREEEGVVGDVSLEQVCMEAGEGVGVVGQFEGVF